MKYRVLFLFLFLFLFLLFLQNNITAQANGVTECKYSEGIINIP